MIRKTLATIGILLFVFHGWLFAGQAWDGQLADLALASRWLIGAGLVFGLYRLARQGRSPFFSRHAVALWVLAALLHGPALADRLRVDAPVAPEAIATLVQVSVGSVALAGLLILAALAFGARRRTTRLIGRIVVVEPFGSDAFSLGSHSLFAPRPPPVR